MTEFEIFQTEFLKYQKLFGLIGYKVYFEYMPLEDSFAEINAVQKEMTATVSLNSKLPDKDKPHRDVKRSAKHEAIHLLTLRLKTLASSRYASADEIYEAWEELVGKLEVLIPNIKARVK